MSTPSLTNSEIDNPRSAASNRNRRSFCSVNRTWTRIIDNTVACHLLNYNLTGSLDMLLARKSRDSYCHTFQGELPYPTPNRGTQKPCRSRLRRRAARVRWRHNTPTTS